MIVTHYLQLIRIKQWYKNLVVFLALFFSENLFVLPALEKTFIAFFILSLISSAGYIINDLRDRGEDQKHLERKHRPLAAGMIKPIIAVCVVFFLLAISSILAAKLGVVFEITTGIFFLLSLVYTFALKRIIFADVITIATLFVVRAIAGAVAINVLISPWLISVPFFLSLYLSAGKRYGDIHLLQEKAGDTKKVLKEYTLEMTNTLMVISTTLLIISYAFYSFLSKHPLLIATLPFALYTIFRYYYLIINGSAIARNPEKIINDPPMLWGIILWLIAAGLIIYYRHLLY